MVYFNIVSEIGLEFMRERESYRPPVAAAA